MTPIPSSDDEANGAQVDTVFLTQLTIGDDPWDVALADFSYLHFGEDCTVSIVPTLDEVRVPLESTAPLPRCIAKVVSTGSKKQMRWLKARGSVAVMANMDARGDFSVRQLPRKAVNQEFPALVSDLAVPIAAQEPCPDQATILPPLPPLPKTLRAIHEVGPTLGGAELTEAFSDSRWRRHEGSRARLASPLNLWGARKLVFDTLRAHEVPPIPCVTPPDVASIAGVYYVKYTPIPNLVDFS